MTAPETINPVLDWHPPSEERKVENQPYRLNVQLGVIRERADPNVKDLNEETPLRSRSWVRRRWLDQLNEGACTGFGAAHCLSTGMKFWPTDDALARHFYYWAKLFDQWAGENYEGSSVQGVMEALKHLGILDGYWWIESKKELIHAIAQFGAVECGTWWKSGMWRVDSNGYVRNTGTKDGGHAYAVSAVDLRRNRARIDNSWGELKWGVRGSAWIDLDELCSLIFDEGGECALPRKRMYSETTVQAILQGLIARPA